MTYDVVIRESLSLPGLRQAPGALVGYAEGLKEPSFQPATPLAAGKRYAWSVRLRRGDTVSSWSTTGYYLVLVAGSGNWFIFATPDGR